MAERRVGLEFVQCERIVDTSADSLSIEGLQNPITTGQSDDMQVMDTAFTVAGAIDSGNAAQRACRNRQQSAAGPHSIHRAYPA